MSVFFSSLKKIFYNKTGRKKKEDI